MYFPTLANVALDGQACDGGVRHEPIGTWLRSCSCVFGVGPRSSRTSVALRLGAALLLLVAALLLLNR